MGPPAETSLTHTGIPGVSPILPGCRHHNQPLALSKCSAVPTPRLLPRSPTARKEEVGNKMAGAYRATPVVLGLPRRCILFSLFFGDTIGQAGKGRTSVAYRRLSLECRHSSFSESCMCAGTRAVVCM